MTENEVLSEEICTCICHSENSQVAHIMPCCFECHICEQRIKSNSYESHKEKCSQHLHEQDSA